MQKLRIFLPGVLALALAGCGSQTKLPTATSAPPAAAAANAPSTPPPAIAHAATATQTAPISLDEWHVRAPSRVVHPGPVTFTVTNAGKIPHEVVVLRTTKPAADLGRGARVPEVVHVGETGNLAAGATKRLSINLPPGHYSLMCNLPGHYMAGMHTDLTVA